MISLRSLILQDHTRQRINSGHPSSPPVSLSGSVFPRATTAMNTVEIWRNQCNVCAFDDVGRSETCLWNRHLGRMTVSARDLTRKMEFG